MRDLLPKWIRKYLAHYYNNGIIVLESRRISRHSRLRRKSQKWFYCLAIFSKFICCTHDDLTSHWRAFGRLVVSCAHTNTHQHIHNCRWKRNNSIGWMMMMVAAEDIVAMTCVTPYLSSVRVRQSELYCVVLCAFAHFSLYSQSTKRRNFSPLISLFTKMFYLLFPPFPFYLTVRSFAHIYRP